jgi:hypothetical protein
VLEENLKQLVADKHSHNLPHKRMVHHDFVDLIGFKEIERLQMKYLEDEVA